MLKVGILGGGQLGRMLLQAAANYPVQTHVLENDPECPAAHLCHHFTCGDIRNFDDVYRFGRSLDKITIEIEQVNIDALERLHNEGVTVIPHPAVLRTIQNKILQKQYYEQQGIATASFRVTRQRSDLDLHVDFLPAVHKTAEGGYDGKGVQTIRTAEELHKGFDSPSVLEQKVGIAKELAVMVAINEKKETAVYPVVEMCFDPHLHLLDYQRCPAAIDVTVAQRAAALALQVVRGLQSPGLFAVELFLDQDNQVLVNETAPRVHNSGHHTIEAVRCSQFDMLWRIILGLPLGSTALVGDSLMINLIGAGNEGPAAYLGLDQLLATPGAYLHTYGKKWAKPGRKMGHVTLMGSPTDELLQQVHQIKQYLQVVGSNT